MTAPKKQKARERVVSGMRATGEIHLGHYWGALKNWIDFQDQYECYFFSADWHALTSEYKDTSKIKEIVYHNIRDWLCLGLDPKKATLFVQSQVKEHAELALILSMITPLSWLERNPTYKDQIQELKDRDVHTHGFLGYPVLQAADILLYKADVVPVGEDQLPHLELAREIARRFNFLYTKIFPEPASSLTQVPKLPGTDGRKMSKSYGNAIHLSDSPEIVDNQVRQMVTDPARKKREDKGHPEVCPVYYYHEVFNTSAKDIIARECREAARGCVECKKEMGGKLKEFLAPIYERRVQYASRKAEVLEILDQGNQKARQIAAKTLAEVREAVGI